MKVLVVGASGLIGAGVSDVLAVNHEVIRASRSSEVAVDITSPESIAAMYAKVGKVDAVVSCAGKVTFKALEEISYEEYSKSLQDKTLGQVELVRQGLEYVNDKGSFTLISGVVGREAIHTGSAAALANGALEQFTYAASIEMPRGIRINTVSPTVLAEAKGYHPYFPGFAQVNLAQVTDAFVKCVEGWSTGLVHKLG
jgi:NAD(P)-dependent dehydrogenase (short-subunit alcohol dehydrogenase family)